MASFFRFASRTAPAMAATAFASTASNRTSIFGSSENKSYCEAPLKVPADRPDGHAQASTPADTSTKGVPLFTPTLPFPMWDVNWDSREPKPSGNDKLDRRRKRYLRKFGVTRHIILIRHGQYDETDKEDEKRILTEMGRQQAHYTGARIAKMIHGTEGDASSPCNVKILRVSGLTRAQETANIIASYIPQIERAEPDPFFNECRPCHTIPGGTPGESTIRKTEEGHKQAEQAFQKLFYRADEIQMPEDDEFLEDGSSLSPPEGDSIETRHEYEIIVCHANLIRYFFCRALQLPPEAWLRLCTFNCSLTYFTIRPTGSVSCRMLGDIGHLPLELQSFSGHHGFNW